MDQDLTLALMTTRLHCGLPIPSPTKKLQSKREWDWMGNVLGQASEDGERLKGVRRQSRFNYRLQGIHGRPWKGKE